MPSFASRHLTPERFSALSLSENNDDMMEDLVHHPVSNTKHAASHIPGSLTLVPSDGGSLLDYFDLPSPPSTPQRATHSSLSFSSLNSFPSPATSPEYASASRRNSLSLSLGSSSSSRSASPRSSPSASPPSTSAPRWPTLAQRTASARLPMRARSRSTSSCSSSSSSSSSSSASTALLADDAADVEMAGTGDLPLSGRNAGERPFAAVPPVPVVVRHARRTPYYPPNASRNVDRARVYMNRGPHYIPNWTPLSSLPRHVQLRIEEEMVRFTAI